MRLRSGLVLLCLALAMVLAPLDAVRAELVLTSTAGESPPAVVNSPFRLSWTINSALYANAVASWTVEFADQTTTLPASQTWIDIDHSVLGPEADGSVIVKGLDSGGRTVVSGLYSFSTYSWWD